MDEKKHIDRLFQERLKDFEVFPDAEVWKNIEEQLVKKKKRRIVPLWLRLGSAAAILLLFVGGGIWMFNSEKPSTKLPNPNSTITDIDSQDKEENLNNTNKLTPEKQLQDGAKRDEEIVVIPNGQQQNQLLKSAVEKKDAIASTENSVKNTSKHARNKDKILDAENSVVAQVTNEENRMHKEELDKLNSIKTDDTALVTNSKTEEAEGEKDINEVLKENNNSVALQEENLNDKKWSVGSSVAPVYYNTLSKGSPIHSALASNEKNSTPSLSYGVKVNYKISDRLSLQSGINALDLSYQTENVTALVTSTNALTNDTNINTNVDGLKVITLSSSIENVSSDVQRQELASFGERSFNNLSGDLNQSLSYLEIPMEAKYALVRKKVGVNIIGGVSTYFLYRNTVNIENQDGSVVLGEASNLNDVNFSGNIGLDLDYKINKKLFINVSPMFKYQLNTYSENDGGFRPYFLGIYTGLNFRF